MEHENYIRKTIYSRKSILGKQYIAGKLHQESNMEQENYPASFGDCTLLPTSKNQE